MISNYDGYVYAIAVLLPISASMLVFQTNPYKALVIRGILGAISALVYTILGAVDVALTEALVGAFLATMLQAVAVRSSLVLRLGVVEEIAIAHDLDEELDKLYLPFEQSEQEELKQPDQFDEHPIMDNGIDQDPASISSFEKLIDVLKNTFSKYYMRVELVPYENEAALEQALIDKLVHATVHDAEPEEANQTNFYQIKIRLRRLYEIMQANPDLTNVQLIHI